MECMQIQESGGREGFGVELQWFLTATSVLQGGSKSGGGGRCRGSERCCSLTMLSKVLVLTAVEKSASLSLHPLAGPALAVTLACLRVDAAAAAAATVLVATSVYVPAAAAPNCPFPSWPGPQAPTHTHPPPLTCQAAAWQCWPTCCSKRFPCAVSGSHPPSPNTPTPPPPPASAHSSHSLYPTTPSPAGQQLGDSGPLVDQVVPFALPTSPPIPRSPPFNPLPPPPTPPPTTRSCCAEQPPPSHLPGSSLAMLAHLLPNMLCAAMMAASSS
jgi:hypothetical protein